MPAGDIKILEKVITAIADITDDFVVLSTHDDVDVVVLKEHKLKVMEALEAYGFRGEVCGSSYRSNDPKCLYGAEMPIQYRDSKGCHVDLQTGLNYNGIQPNTLVPIDDKFQKYAIDTKVKTDDFRKYELSPEANVVHTVCRIIYDKRTVPPHYKERLDKNITNCDADKLKHAFSMALFKFGDRAFELVMERKYDVMFQEYISYADY